MTDGVVEDIVMRVSLNLNISRKLIMSRDRHEEIVNARHVIWYALYLRGYSLTSLGRMFKRHHGAILHAVKRVRFLMETNDNTFRKVVDKVASVLDVETFKHKYEVDITGRTIVYSSKPLDSRAIRERALVEMERGCCELKLEAKTNVQS